MRYLFLFSLILVNPVFADDAPVAEMPAPAVEETTTPQFVQKTVVSPLPSATANEAFENPAPALPPSDPAVAAAPAVSPPAVPVAVSTPVPVPTPAPPIPTAVSASVPEAQPVPGASVPAAVSGASVPAPVTEATMPAPPVLPASERLDFAPTADEGYGGVELKNKSKIMQVNRDTASVPAPEPAYVPSSIPNLADPSQP